MKTVRIAEDVGGWYVTADGEVPDTSGRAYPSRRAAIRHLREVAGTEYADGATHYWAGDRRVRL